MSIKCRYNVDKMIDNDNNNRIEKENVQNINEQNKDKSTIVSFSANPINNNNNGDVSY